MGGAGITYLMIDVEQVRHVQINADRYSVSAKLSHQPPYISKPIVKSNMFAVQVQFQEKSPSSPSKRVLAPLSSYIEILEPPLC